MTGLSTARASRARTTVPTRLRPERLVAPVAGLLLATALLQMPLTGLHLPGGVFHVRSWDIGWLLFAIILVAVLARRPAVNLPGPRALRSPIGLWALYAVVGTLSLAWLYSNFGSDHFVDCAIRAVRLVSLAALAWLLV